MMPPAVFDAVASLLQVSVALSASSCALFAFVSLPIIMPTMTKPSYPPSAVQKECQRVIHFIAHNSVFKMEDLTDEQKKAKLFSLVHGPEDPQSDQISLNYLFLNGKQQFAGAFDHETINVTDQDASTNEQLILKEVLHRQGYRKYIVGRDITHRLISSSTLKGNNKVEGRTIKNNSETAKKNALKCIAYAKIWVNRQDVSPSGLNWDDMYEHVFNEMQKYFLTTRKEEVEHAETDDQDDDNCSGQLQSGLFPGWMVFVLFGPFGPEPRLEIEWLQESPNSANGQGRKDARKGKAERESKERSKHIGLELTWGRGMTFDQRAVAASIAQREDSEARKDFDTRLYALQLEVGNLLKQKDQQIKLMEITGGLTGPNFNEYLDTLNALDSQIKKSKDEIEYLKSQKRTSNPIVSSLLASISDTVDNTKRRKTASPGGDSSVAPSAEVEVRRRSPAVMSTLTDDSVQEDEQEEEQFSRV
jgi:hypothetical protein